MNRELLTLFGCVTLPAALEGPLVHPIHVDVFNTEIAVLGYTFDGACLDRLRSLSRSQFVDLRRQIIDHLLDITGGSKRHQTLFAGFPHHTPDQHEYLLARVLGHVQEVIGYAPKDVQILSCGHVIDLTLFDLREFGACPICQRQVDQIPYARRTANMSFARLTPLKIISHADDGALAERGNALLARSSSLSAAEKAFLRGVAERVELRLPERLFKETLPFAYALFGREAIMPHLSGATDVLRILAFVSDPEGADLSLAKPTRLTLRARHVKDALAMLENLSAIEEDLLRHAGRWKIFARDAHVGQARFRRRFPRTTAAFDRLLSAQKGIVTFGRKVEPLIRARRVAPLLEELSARPGEFMRKLDFMLRNRADDDEAALVLATLRKVAPNVTLKLLFEVKKYLEHRDGSVGQRVFLPKGSDNKVQIAPDMRAAIRDEDLLGAIEAIDAEIHSRLKQHPPMGRVHLDPALAKIVMPYNRRGESSTSVPVAKGSRFPIAEKAEVLRLFVHWTGMIDVDLSVVTLTQNFDVVEQVSWTNLRTRDMHHSGDIQRAPKGASEFIDARLAPLLQTSTRYLAISLISYTGQTFDEFPCFAGFMERDDLNSGEVYEPQALALKFDLNGRTRSCMPLLFDLWDHEVIFVDLAVGGGHFQAVQSQRDKFQALARMAVDLQNTKPTAWDVLRAHIRARGTLAADPTEADLVFDRESLKIEDIMALMA